MCAEVGTLAPMSPFGIETIPAEVLKALRTLPLIAERLDEVARHTSVLPEVRSGIAALGEQLDTMDGRMATIEDAMPVLVEVQGHLDKLPETMQALDTGISGLTDLLNRLTTSLGTLDQNVASLQESMEPLGRLADRLPGGNR